MFSDLFLSFFFFFFVPVVAVYKTLTFIFCLFSGKSDIQSKLENALQDVNDKYLILEETEKNAVRTALIEERSRFCMFVTCFKPFVVSDKNSNLPFRHTFSLIFILGRHLHIQEKFKMYGCKKMLCQKSSFYFDYYSILSQHSLLF